MSEVALPSWNDTATRSSIVEFVESVDVPPEERIAVFDNDGTLWSEKPMPVELGFILERLAEMAETGRVAARAPALEGRLRARPRLARRQRSTSTTQGDDGDLKLLLGGVLGAFAGWTVEEYGATSPPSSDREHPTSDRRYRLRLPADGRAAALPGGQRVHQLHRVRRRPGLHAAGRRGPLRHPAGAGRSAARFALDVPRGRRARRRLQVRARLLRRRPGEAGADLEPDRPPPARWPAATPTATSRCCSFAGGASRPALRLLVLHDDAEREFDYTAGAERSLERAKADGWTVVSVKDDWKTVFAP